MGLFGRFTRPRARLSLKTEKYELFFGEEVKGFAEINSAEEFDIEGIWVFLVCRESIKKTRRILVEGDRGRKHWEDKEYWDTATLYSDCVKACNEMHVSQGLLLGVPFALKLPSLGRETYHSVDRNLRWEISATMKIKQRRSIETMYEVIVAKPSATQKEVLREVVLIPCSYCGGLIPQTPLVCPNCGARRKA